jgi:uncharacterized membrane protein YesL
MNTNISLRFMRANVICSLFTFGGGIVLAILPKSIAIMRSNLKKKSGSVWRASSNSHT